MADTVEGAALARRDATPAVRQDSAAQAELGARLLDTTPEHAAKVISHAASVARVFRDTIRDSGLVVTIATKQGRREFVREQGWELLAQLLGAHVKVGEPEPFDLRDRPDAKGARNKMALGWRAMATVHAADGRELAADWGVCLRTEQRWAEADEYAVMGMAGTRAARRALTRALGWIVALAGLEPSPAPDVDADPPPQPAPAPQRAADPALDADPGPEGDGAPLEGEVVDEPPPAPPPPAAPKAAAPREASADGKIRAAQLRQIATRRGLSEAALEAALESAGIRTPAASALELGDEARYIAALEAVSRAEVPA